LEKHLQDNVDLEARRRALDAIRRSFLKLVDQVERGEEPRIVVKKRTLDNTIYDPKRKLLLLGNKKLVRKFFDEGETRRFMQTVLMASIIYEALANNEYPTIRDLYYRGKHSLPQITPNDRVINTWDEQKESDTVLCDVEVLTGMLREEMLILSKEKGKVVGNMRIKSGPDTIDLSKMGHGAYAIEPTPDLIEFKDVDAEYVLVVEKDAVFQQLHRIGYWRKTRSILVTSAGQPDRATRRFVRRLNEELKLPVYVLTDSIPADEVVVIRDPTSGEVRIGPVEELVGGFFSGLERERISVPLEVLSWSPVTGRVRWSPVGYIYRHRVREPILRIRTRGRGVVRVTKAHSLFVFRDGKVRVVPAKEIRPGDYIIVAERLPDLVNSGDPTIVIASLLGKAASRDSRRGFDLRNAINLLVDGWTIRLEEASNEEALKAEAVKLSRSKRIVPNVVSLDEDLAWLMGLYTARGNSHRDRYLVFNLSTSKREKVEKVAKMLREKFNIEPRVVANRAKGLTRVTIGSRVLYMLFEELGLVGAIESRRVPSIIVNSPPTIVLAYLKGLIDGDGSIDERGNVAYSTRSSVLARQLFLLLLSLGVNPTLVQNGEDNTIRIDRNPTRTPPEIYEYVAGRKAKPGRDPLSERIYSLPVTDELKKRLAELASEKSPQHLSESESGTITKAELRDLLKRGLVDLDEGYRVLVNGDSVVVRVDAVEEEGYEGYVYDFAVPGDNSFIGGYGVVYHNSDPYGFYIYSVFKIGSITLSYESERLATPSARFLGVMMSDVFGDDVPVDEIHVEDLDGKGDGSVAAKRELKESFLKALKRYGYKGKLDKKPYLTKEERKTFIIRANQRDIARAIELVGQKVVRDILGREPRVQVGRGEEKIKRSPGYEWFKDPRWIKEIGIFLLTRSKLEIEAIASKGLKFLAFEYLPTKIETGDWIE